MKITERIKQTFAKFKKWFIGLLVAIGLVSVPVVMAGSKDFSWTNPTQNVDGSVFNPETDQLHTKIYCVKDGSEAVPVMTIPGAQTSYTADLAPGDYECYGTVANMAGIESAASNTVTFTIDPPIPLPPVLNP